jgi:hypothetical protein
MAPTPRAVQGKEDSFQKTEQESLPLLGQSTFSASTLPLKLSFDATQPELHLPVSQIPIPADDIPSVLLTPNAEPPKIQLQAVKASFPTLPPRIVVVHHHRNLDHHQSYSSRNAHFRWCCYHGQCSNGISNKRQRHPACHAEARLGIQSPPFDDDIGSASSSCRLGPGPTAGDSRRQSTYRKSQLGHCYKPKWELRYCRGNWPDDDGRKPWWKPPDNGAMRPDAGVLVSYRAQK